jgi:hypothetical protein
VEKNEKTHNFKKERKKRNKTKEAMLSITLELSGFPSSKLEKK